jgi:serine/threonine protein kinase
MLSETSMGSVGNDASAAAMQPYFPGSATIAGYTILSPIPEPGAQADVYVARDDDNQIYAVKLYRGLTTPSAATAQALAQLSSRQLLLPLFQGQWQGRAVEITRLFPLGNLADFIKRNGPLNKDQASRLVRQVTEGLEQLHGAGVQHRDLKPTNILMRSEEPLELVLADFGLSALADSTVLTQPYGTLFYAAPETLTGMYSRASDYWSLGIILVEALSGNSIAATLRNDALLPYRLVQGKVPIPPSIPKGWQPLLKRLLQRDHYRRWQAAEVHSWLDREGRKVGVAAEKKARPLFIASLALALALTIGAGLCLNPGVPARIDMLAIAFTTTTALAWILSGIFLLVGVTHTLSGAPHGPISVLVGIFLAVGAYFLPRLWG